MLGRILVFLGGLLVVVLFAALLAPLFVDWTDFRSNFELQASRVLGKKVTVNGEVKARILPFPSVTLHDVTVGPDSSGQPLVHVARFSMDAELAPFLSGEARIFDMRIEEPRVRVRLLKNGTLDWLRGSRPEIPAKTVVLESVHVTGGDIEFIDEQTGRTRRIEGLEADMSAKSLAGPWTVEGRAVVDGEAGHFSISSLQADEATGALPLRTRLHPDERPFDIALEGVLAVKDGRPGYEGRFEAAWRDVDPAEASANAPPAPVVKGEFSLTNERIRVPSYRLELGDAENPYAVTGEATLDTGVAAEFLLTADGQQIDVARLGNGGANGKTGRDPTMSARQRLMRLVEQAALIPIPGVPGKATLRLPAIVAGDTVVRDIQLDVRPAGASWIVEKGVATLPGRTQVEAAGRLNFSGEPSFAGDLLVASTQPSGLSSWLAGGVDPAIRQLSSLGFSAKVDLTDRMQRFESLELAIGPATLHGRIERQSPDQGTPNLSLDLSGNALDLDAVRAIYSLVAGENNGEAFFAHQIGARLKVDRFSAEGMDATGVDTVFTLGEEGFELDRLRIADLGGAALSASGRAGGSLLDYRGEGTISLVSADPTGFLGVLRSRLPSHPLLERLSGQADWYADSNVTAKVEFGEGQGGGLGVRIGGTVNGSRLDLNYHSDELADITGAAPTRLDLTLANADSAVLLGQAGLQPLPISAGEGGLLTLRLASDGEEPADATLTFTTDKTVLTVDGNVSLAAEDFLSGKAHLSIESGDIEPYLLMNGVALPQMLSGLPVKGSVDLDLVPGRLAATAMEFELGGNPLSGELTVDWTNGRTSTLGEVALGRADLDWLAELVLGPVRNSQGDLNEAPLTMAIGRQTDVSLELEAGRFSVGMFEDMTEVGTSLTVKDGALRLEAFKGNWLGGTVEGRLALTNADTTGFLETRMNVSKANLASILPSGSQEPVATGRFDLELIGESSGKSVRELVSGVNGSGNVALSDVAVARFGLGLMPALLTEVDSWEGEINAERVAPVVERLLGLERLMIESVSVPFTLADGTARVQNLAVTTPQATIRADARLSIDTAQLDATASVALDAGDQALAAAAPAFRLALAGDAASPEVNLDVSDLSNFLSLRVFERERRRVETLQSNVLEKQRLRREVALYRFRNEQRQAERERADLLLRARLYEEERLRAIAADRRKARERPAPTPQAADNGSTGTVPSPLPDTPEPTPGGNVLPVAPGEAVIRGEPLPPLKFDGLPGVN